MTAQQSALLKKIAGTGADYEHEAARAELDALLANDLAHRLVQLSTDINHSKRIIGERLDALATTGVQLGTAITSVGKQIEAAGVAGSQQAESLNRWTRWLAFVTGALVLAAVAQVVATIMHP